MKMKLPARICLGLMALTLFTASAPALSVTENGDEEKAEIGRDDWLVFRGNLPDYRRTRPLSDEELATINGNFVKLHDSLGKHGSTLLWAIAPNTTTVYPESVAPHVRVAKRASVREQLAQSMATLKPQHFLDLTAAQLQEKSRYLLYRKTDTHWNDVGAYFGYREIMQRLATLRPELAARLKPMPLENFTMEVRKTEGGGIARIMGLQSELTEENPFLTPKQPSKVSTQTHEVWDPHAATPRSVPSKNPTITSDNPAACPGPKVMIYRDSFATAALPFLLEHFCKATVVWYRNGQVDLAQAEREKPEIVLFMNTERMIRPAARAMSLE